MEIVYFLVPMALILGGAFLLAFIYAVKTDQLEDLDTPAHRILMDDHKERKV